MTSSWSSFLQPDGSLACLPAWMLDESASQYTISKERLLGDWLFARDRRMGALIKSRPKGEPAPSKGELDRRAEIIMRDYIAAAADIESLTTPLP